jgi:RimJ/RimL family protein N-acetyltransferase
MPRQPFMRAPFARYLAGARSAGTAPVRDGRASAAAGKAVTGAVRPARSRARMAPWRRPSTPPACSGLSPFEHAPGGVELLYSLDPTHWSKALATEAATAVLAYAFEVLALPEILATTDDANHPSIRTLTRLGATRCPASRSAHTYLCYRLHPQPPRYAPSEPL